MVPRRVLEREPLTEDPELAWHAYAVEYGLRVRARGRRVCVVDIPLTHNSLTVNLDRLELAYATIAAKHPAGMPVVTPQGKVPRDPRADRAPQQPPLALSLAARVDPSAARPQGDARRSLGPLGRAPRHRRGARADPGRRATPRHQRGRARRLRRRTTGAAGAPARRPARTAHLRHAGADPRGARGGRRRSRPDHEPPPGRRPGPGRRCSKPAARSWASGRRSGTGRCSGFRGRRSRRPGGSAGRRRSASPATPPPVPL